MCPMSLINTDTKIFSKLVAKRLDNVPSGIVEDDQNGFINGRQGFHYVRCVLNILYNRNEEKDTAPLSLDVEKAFDRFE